MANSEPPLPTSQVGWAMKAAMEWEQTAKDLRAAIDAALHELGEPQPGYPAPVANAIEILLSAQSRGGTEPRS